MADIVKDINSLLQQYFDKVIVLTVARFKDRQEKITKRLEGISFDFFYGVDKNELDTDCINRNYVYDKKLSLSVRQQFKEMNSGEIACALSHRKIYQAVIDNNWQRVLILEDDVIPDWEKLTMLSTSLKEMPADWELFYLGYLKNEKITAGLLLKQAWYKTMRFFGHGNLSNKQLSNIAPRPFSNTLMKAGFHDCTHAYAISNEGAKKLIAAQTPVKYRADNLLTALILNSELNGYASKSFLFNQEIFSDGSDESHVREPQKLSVS